MRGTGRSPPLPQSRTGYKIPTSDSRTFFIPHESLNWEPPGSSSPWRLIFVPQSVPRNRTVTGISMRSESCRYYTKKVEDYQQINVIEPWYNGANIIVPEPTKRSSY